jgi:hypothetical protein
MVLTIDVIVVNDQSPPFPWHGCDFPPENRRNPCTDPPSEQAIKNSLLKRKKLCREEV